MSRKLRRYRGWIAAIVLVVIGGAVFVFYRQANEPVATTTYQTEAAATGTISVTVSGTGNLEVDGTTDVYPESAGTVAAVEVAKGELVATGTVLFTLDAADAEARTAQAYVGYKQASQGVVQARGSLEKAEATLANLKERYAAQEAAAATAANSAPASTTTQTATALADTTGPATQDNGGSATTAATVEVTQADIDAATADIETAEAGLASAKAQLSSASITYDQAQDDEGSLSVTAPCSGRVYSLSVEVGDSVSASGDSASLASSSSQSSSGTGASTGASTGSSSGSSSAPVVLSSDQPLGVHLTVNEVDLPTLEVGQRADIEFDALPDLTATGKVYEIGDEGTVSSGVVTFDVWISLDVADGTLRTGMSSAATIVTEVARDAVLVPNSAVKTNDDGTYYVEVLEAGAATPQQVAVEIGLANSTQTQILSGISEGDMVVTSTSDASADSESGPDSGGGMMMMGGGPRG